MNSTRRALPLSNIKRLANYCQLRRKQEENACIKLDCMMDNSPIIFFTEENISAGAVASGQVIITAKVESLELKALTVGIYLDLYFEQPLQRDCKACSKKQTILEQWTILNHCTTLAKGDHQFPFSTLLGAHHPTSTRNPLVAVCYRLKIAAVSGASHTILQLEMPLIIKRSLPRPEVLFHYVSTFVPTGIRCDVRYDRVIYPTGVNVVHVTLTGLAVANSEGNILGYWRLGDVGWTLEEIISVAAPACEKHNRCPANREWPANEGTIKRSTRTLSKGILDRNWELGCSADGVCAKLDFQYDVTGGQENSVSFPQKRGKNGFTPDFHGRGIEVSHSLALEIEAHSRNALINMSTGLDQSSLLRMSMPVCITELPGGQVSWEDQITPLYGSISPSPPAYSD